MDEESRKMLIALENQGKECTGCGACNNICPTDAISMKESRLGFLQPHVTVDKCIHCDLCLKVCPVLNPRGNENDCTPDCYAACMSNEIRRCSSSGGVFTALAERILDRGGVVFGAALEGKQVCHRSAQNREELAGLRKSKYTESDMGYMMREAKQALRAGKPVLFSGCPCQIAGLKAYLERENCSQLYTADILCHGVPSGKMFRESLAAFEEKVSAVDFRDKNYGWESLGMTITLKSGEKKRLSFDESRYEQGFHSNLTLRESCYHCRFCSFPRQGDVSIGDFWGIEAYDPDLADGRGTSAVLVNSKKGTELFSEIKADAQRLASVPLIYLSNNRLQENIVRDTSRDRFLRLYPDRYPFDKAVLYAQQHRHDIGIVGNWSYPNYGSELTYYALYCFVRSLGYEAVMLSWPKDSEWPPYEHAQLFLHDPYPKEDIAELPEDREELAKYNEHCDTFLLGSDQLLNNNLYRWFGRFVQLDWVYSTKRKVGYATSFGTDYIWGSEEDRAELAYFLRQFDAISCRETSGSTLLEQKFGVWADEVLDPVFLAPTEMYTELIERGRQKVPSCSYIFSYVLDFSKEKERFLRQCEGELGFKMFLATDAAPEEHRFHGYDTEQTMSGLALEEWLACIAMCNYMLTDSYHGMCMAILHRKPFLVLGNTERGITRFSTLLSKLELGGRLLTSVEQLEEKVELLHEPIDYEAVYSKLERLRQQSMVWLEEALKLPVDRKILTSYDLLTRKQRKQREELLLAHEGRKKNCARIDELNRVMLETDEKQWRQLEADCTRMDEINRVMLETDEKQWRQLEANNARMDEMNRVMLETDEKQWRQLEADCARMDEMNRVMLETDNKQWHQLEVDCARMDKLERENELLRMRLEELEKRLEKGVLKRIISKVLPGK